MFAVDAIFSQFRPVQIPLEVCLHLIFNFMQKCIDCQTIATAPDKRFRALGLGTDGFDDADFVDMPNQCGLPINRLHHTFKAS